MIKDLGGLSETWHDRRKVRLVVEDRSDLNTGTSPRVAQKMGGKAKAMTKEALQQYFDMPMVDVAKIFGVCPTYFKRICRSHGIMRWPYRKVVSCSYAPRDS